jgi:hypothetical protein
VSATRTARNALKDLTRPPLMTVPGKRVDTVLLLAGRVVGAALLVWMGWIHLHLWSDGYKHLPTIGTLFILNFVGAIVLAVAVLATPPRFLALPSAAGALMAATTLVSLAISINIGLFGFTDYLDAPFVHLSIWVESAAFVVLAVTTVGSLVLTRR